ncbi:hypothetical protein [Pyrococcus kukulkanii]|uniref:Uncharacterized protein n=1 Tax=Pyrococcus kukulkanii TaxID=1609559 RepID=A0ABV4T5W7_9EURY
MTVYYLVAKNPKTKIALSIYLGTTCASLDSKDNLYSDYLVDKYRELVSKFGEFGEVMSAISEDLDSKEPQPIYSSKLVYDLMSLVKVMESMEETLDAYGEDLFYALVPVIITGLNEWKGYEFEVMNEFTYEEFRKEGEYLVVDLDDLLDGRFELGGVKKEEDEEEENEQ